MKKNYTDDRGMQILLSVLKHNNIKKIIASPGTTNVALVASVQHDPFFEVYSCVDERSACYMACGLAVESNEPVVLTCTGATASRNYLPGLTEAFYRKIPILAVTCTQHFGNIGNNIPQSIDRTSQLKDTVNLSVQIPIVNSKEDEYGCNFLINKAILELKHNGGGPVHINITTNGKSYGSFTTKELPSTRYIDRIEYNDELPKLKKNKIGIFVGAHKKWSIELLKTVEQFCEKYNAVVICDYTSNYTGKYGILANIVCDQELYKSRLNDFDLIIYIGDISGAYLNLNSQETWRVNPDGYIRDPFKNLKYVFQMQEIDFFKKYNTLVSNSQNNLSFFESWKKEADELNSLAKQSELPLSNIWVAKTMIEKIPEKSTIHLAILNSLRSWNYFCSNKDLNVFTNTGGFGIDGAMSTLIGASLANPNKIYYGVIGDLAFFYDLNSLGNHFIKNNLRIILINNGCGTEFHNYSHPARQAGLDVSDYIAADGHFGNKSPNLVKDFANNLGFQYISAQNKDEVLEYMNMFTDSKLYEKSIIFEIFTNAEDESNALQIIRSLKKQSKVVIKNTIKKNLPKPIINKVKKIVKK